jgi:hypothetical protein
VYILENWKIAFQFSKIAISHLDLNYLPRSGDLSGTFTLNLKTAVGDGGEP